MATEIIGNKNYNDMNPQDRRYINGTNAEITALAERLTAEGIAFSGRINGYRDVITVDSEQSYNRAMAILQEIRTQNKSEFIGNTPFKYFGRNNRTIIAESTEVIKAVAERFERENVRYSGVISGNTAKITVFFNDTDKLNRYINEAKNVDIFAKLAEMNFQCTVLADNISVRNMLTGEEKVYRGMEELKTALDNTADNFLYPTTYRISLTSDAYTDIYYISAYNPNTEKEKYMLHDEDGWTLTFNAVNDAIDYAQSNSITLTNTPAEIADWRNIETESAKAAMVEQSKEYVKKLRKNEDHFVFNDNGTVTWSYFNPDGNNGNGQFVEHTIAENDIIMAYENRINSPNEFDGRRNFFETLYSSSYTELIDADTEEFVPYAQSFIDEVASEKTVIINNISGDYSYDEHADIISRLESTSETVIAAEKKRTEKSYTMQLIEKAEREYNDFTASITTAAEAIDRAYEISMKKEILIYFNELEEEESELIFTAYENPLDAVYNEWLSNDYNSISDDISVTFTGVVNSIRSKTEKEGITDIKPPFVFMVKQHGETAFFRNDEMTVEQLKRECVMSDRPFLYAINNANRISGITFAEISQSDNGLAVEIDVDNKLFRVFNASANEISTFNEIKNETLGTMGMAIEYINDYINQIYGDSIHSEFNYNNIPIEHFTVGRVDKCYFDMAADLDSFEIRYSINGTVLEIDTFHSLEEMNKKVLSQLNYTANRAMADRLFEKYEYNQRIETEHNYVLTHKEQAVDDEKNEPPRHVEFTENQLAPSVLNGSENSITETDEDVKAENSPLGKSLPTENSVPDEEEVIITQADIDILRTLPPRKSVLNFTEEEKSATLRWAARFKADIGEKSPYFRADSEWRDSEENVVPVVNVLPHNNDFRKTRQDIKDAVIPRGTVINTDTGWNIQVSRVGLEDTIKYGIANDNDTVYDLIYYVNDIIKNSVLLDTDISEGNNKNKAYNTAFMHKLYGLCNINGEPCLAKVTVEEFKNSNDSTLKRMYNLQDIKIEPLMDIEFIDNLLARSFHNGSEISIADLFALVKACDKDFYMNSPDYALVHREQAVDSEKSEPSRHLSFTAEQPHLSVLNGSENSITETDEDVKSENSPSRNSVPDEEEVIITQADIDILRTLPPRKSVLNFTEEEKNATLKWAARFKSDIGEKSPYFRADSEWRDSEENVVPVIAIEDKAVDFKTVRDDIKKQIIDRGVFVNSDTGWNIQVSRNGLEDSVKYGFKHKNTTVYAMLYSIENIIKNSVYLDTVTSEKNNGSKANNTAFMHKLYSICQFDDEPYIAKVTVEEFKNSDDSTLKRMYNLQDIKIEPLRHIEFTDFQLARSVLNGSEISIADLFALVKACDNLSFPKTNKQNLINPQNQASPGQRKIEKSKNIVQYKLRYGIMLITTKTKTK